MTSSSKPLRHDRHITVDLDAVPAGIPRHMSYRAVAPHAEQPTWYAQLQAQDWTPPAAVLHGGASDAWGATTHPMMTRMDALPEELSLEEPSFEGLRPAKPQEVLQPPPLPSKEDFSFPAPAPKATEKPVPAPQLPMQRERVPAPPQVVPAPQALVRRPAPARQEVVQQRPQPPVRLPRPNAQVEQRQALPVRRDVQPEIVVRPAPEVEPTPFPGQPGNARAHVDFVRDALKPQPRYDHGTSTLGDRTENLPAPPAPGAAKEMVNVMRALKSKLPKTDTAKRKEAQTLANWLRNTGMVGLDADANDVVLRRFNSDSNKLDWMGIRKTFPGINDHQVASLTRMLARKWQYQDLENWLSDEPSMTAAIFGELNPEKVPNT